MISPIASCIDGLGAEVVFKWPDTLPRRAWSVACGRGCGWLTRLLHFRCRRAGFLMFLCRRDHLFHPFLNLVDLGMHFLDEVMFQLGQLFNALALLPKLFQKITLFG